MNCPNCDIPMTRDNVRMINHCIKCGAMLQDRDAYMVESEKYVPATLEEYKEQLIRLINNADSTEEIITTMRRIFK